MVARNPPPPPPGPPPARSRNSAATRPKRGSSAETSNWGMGMSTEVDTNPAERRRSSDWAAFGLDDGSIASEPAMVDESQIVSPRSHATTESRRRSHTRDTRGAFPQTRNASSPSSSNGAFPRSSRGSSSPRSSTGQSVSTWMVEPISNDLVNAQPVGVPFDGRDDRDDSSRSMGSTTNTFERQESRRASGTNRPPMGRTPPRVPPSSSRGNQPGRSTSSVSSASSVELNRQGGRARSRSLSRGPINHRSRSTSRQRSGGDGKKNSRSRSTSRPRIRSRSSSRTRQDGNSRSRNGVRSRSLGPNRFNVQGNSAHMAQGNRSDNRSSASSVGPGIEPHVRDNVSDANIGRSIMFDNNRNAQHSRAERRPSLTVGLRKEGSFMEKLFGDPVSNKARNVIPPSSRVKSSATTNSSSLSALKPELIHQRMLLPATVYHNRASDLWVATINTNQRAGTTNQANASKYLKAFSFETEREARESVIANAPPKMMPFIDCPNCFICQGKFAVFRRACHCRNCGVCVCNNCSVTWSSKLLPETYNLKSEASVRVCSTCEFLSTAFMKALMAGNYEEAIALFGTGNINLRVPFPSFKGEQLYPIHCAAQGGHLGLFQWLVNDHFCPIRVIQSVSKKKKRGEDIPILTSKGRSVLSIAVDRGHVDILRFLVIDKQVSVREIKNLKTALRALEKVLNAFPSGGEGQLVARRRLNSTGLSSAGGGDFDMNHSDECSLSSFDEAASGVNSSEAVEHESAVSVSPDQFTVADAADACIICYANTIDCVITPCGHQICCLECSANLSLCPVCNSESQFIRVFKP